MGVLSTGYPGGFIFSLYRGSYALCMKAKYPKEFGRWSGHKEHIDLEDNPVDFREREIWWCSIGVNVGREQQSQTADFSRPVLIMRRFTSDIFWAVPLTTKVKDDKFRFRFILNNIENDVLLFHMRSFDRKRLVRKIGDFPRDQFEAVVESIVAILKNEIPLSGEISEAEANV